MSKLETLLNTADNELEHVAALYNWSTNFESGKGPFALFLDLIGWSADELGEPIYSLHDASLGYMELDRLASALSAYTYAPTAVREYVDALMAAESLDDEDEDESEDDE